MDGWLTSNSVAGLSPPVRSTGCITVLLGERYLRELFNLSIFLSRYRAARSIGWWCRFDFKIVWLDPYDWFTKRRVFPWNRSVLIYISILKIWRDNHTGCTLSHYVQGSTGLVVGPVVDFWFVVALGLRGVFPDSFSSFGPRTIEASRRSSSHMGTESSSSVVRFVCDKVETPTVVYGRQRRKYKCIKDRYSVDQNKCKP